jgi:hypothetical protein
LSGEFLAARYRVSRSEQMNPAVHGSFFAAFYHEITRRMPTLSESANFDGIADLQTLPDL